MITKLSKLRSDFFSVFFLKVGNIPFIKRYLIKKWNVKIVDEGRGWYGLYIGNYRHSLSSRENIEESIGPAILSGYKIVQILILGGVSKC